MVINLNDIYDIAGLIIKIKPIYDSFYEDNLIHYQTKKQHAYEIESSLALHIKPMGTVLLKSDQNRFFYEMDDQIIIQVKNKVGKIKYQISYDKACHKQSILIDELLNQNPWETEYILISMAFLEIAVRQGFICLHASALLLHDEVILFSAPSRTGKSTHVSYYRSVFPDARIINDDKPIIKDGFVYGTPFSGKSKYNLNVRYPLKHIIFLKQGTNDIKEIDEDRKIKLLMKNMLRPEVANTWDKLIPNINEVLKLDMFEASVSHDVSSVYTTYYGVIKGNNMKIKPGFILKKLVQR